MLVVGKGSSSKRFTVPKPFLLKSSTYFQSCCSGEDRSNSLSKALRFRRSGCDKKTIKLPDFDPEIFAIYLHWLYTEKLVFADYAISDLAALSREERNALSPELHEAIFNLAILAYQLEDPTFQNLLIDNLLQIHASPIDLPFPALMRLVFDGLPPSSQMRKLLVRIFATSADADMLERERRAFPVDLYVDMAVELRRAAAVKVVLRAPGVGWAVLNSDPAGNLGATQSSRFPRE